jgi:hypothetical protein
MNVSHSSHQFGMREIKTDRSEWVYQLLGWNVFGDEGKGEEILVLYACSIVKRRYSPICL